MRRDQIRESRDWKEFPDAVRPRRKPPLQSHRSRQVRGRKKCLVLENGGNAVAENGFQRLRFDKIVVARAGSVRVDVIDVGRFQTGALQRNLHRGDRACAFGMRRGGVMCVAACAPAGEPRQNFSAATFVQTCFRFQNWVKFAGAPSAKTFRSGAFRIERTATFRIYEQQRMKSTPCHARQ